MKTGNNKFKEYYNNGFLYKVKIFYSNGEYKYANFFDINDYNLGIKFGTILKYRKMNFIEKLLFKNCI